MESGGWRSNEAFKIHRQSYLKGEVDCGRALIGIINSVTAVLPRSSTGHWASRLPCKKIVQYHNRHGRRRLEEISQRGLEFRTRVESSLIYTPTYKKKGELSLQSMVQTIFDGYQINGPTIIRRIRNAVARIGVLKATACRIRKQGTPIF